jgi:DNA-binding Xre family transcriptional regulator
MQAHPFKNWDLHNRIFDNGYTSVSKFAESINMSHLALYNIISRYTNPRASTIQKICEALNARPTEIGLAQINKRRSKK